MVFKKKVKEKDNYGYDNTEKLVEDAMNADLAGGKLEKFYHVKLKDKQYATGVHVVMADNIIIEFNDGKAVVRESTVKLLKEMGLIDEPVSN